MDLVRDSRTVDRAKENPVSFCGDAASFKWVISLLTFQSVQRWPQYLQTTGTENVLPAKLLL